MSSDRIDDETTEQRLVRYREATARVEAPAALLVRLVQGVPRRARLRRFVRDARAALLVAALVGGSSGLWAHLEHRRLERDLYVKVGAWVEAP